MSKAWRIRALVLAVGMACGSAAWGVLPTGAQVVSGTAQIGSTGGVMSITNSPNAIINWQSFSIGQSEAVRFLQQSAGSAVLNRVVGGQMSQLMGRLTSNGQVFLVNPSGIVVGAGAVIDTAGFVASTLQMQDQDFLAGKLRFQGDAGSGKILNQGWIRTGYGGSAVLIAPNIENSGLIEAPGGRILLAAGQKITLTSLDLGGLSFEVQAPTDAALNLGQLIADGGVVKMFAGNLKHSGDIRANALTRDAAGAIVLRGKGDVELVAGSSTVANGGSGGSIRIESDAGAVRVAGTVSAVGSSGAGGSVDVLGDRVVLTGNTMIDASGASAGGSIRVGGDWQGGNPGLKNAQAAFVGAGVTLKADATDKGDGGKVVVWSDGDTRFLGSLSARGGPRGGNGGQAEVSGKGDLLFIGGADLGAPKGSSGSLLLDPLDLFVDTAGGLNPSIIDESTDFPNHAVTVSPATLAAITGNVTLHASRDLRLNSPVALTGAGQALAASAGRDMQLGAGISTSGGAVSLAAARNMSTFGATPITTAGGSVTLTAQSLSLGSMTASAGAGNLVAAASAGALIIGTVSSAGNVNLAATGGNLSTSSITAAGTVVLNTTGSLSAGSVATGGGALTASAAGGTLSVSSIDTRAGGGPTGAAVTLVSSPSSVSTSTVQAGDANVSMSGTSVSASTVTTTGNVAMTANAGNISATIDNAAGVTATSNRSVSSTSISISSNTALNATSVIATATTCSTTSSCPGASVTLSGNQGVNVGTVTASAPATTNRAVPFNAISETVTITSSAGSISAMSGASQVTATNVTLQTNQGSGGGIGTAATVLKVNNARNFTFRPNGEFNVLLNGSGPNQLAIQPGVAATGQTYSGTLQKPGAIAFTASATDTTVTVSNFAVTGGFDDLVFNSSPSISLAVPNGSLVATSIAVPAGDQVGRPQPTFPFTNVIQALPVTVSASQDLTVAAFARAAGSQAKSSTFTATNGALALGNIAAGRDSVSASGSTGVTVNALSTAGSVTVSSASGGISVDSLASSAGNVSLTANNGTVGAVNDGPGVEVVASGSLAVSANRIGTAGFTNPLDLAAGSISLTATSGSSPRIGSDAAATNPVSAATTNLTLNTGGVFNVDTRSADLLNLTVTAAPSGVGAGGTAQVSSNGTTYAFASDGSNFTLANWTAPAAQFAGGTLRFTSTAGNITLNNIDFAASNGSLAVKAAQLVTGNVTQAPGSTLDLGTGTLTINADNNVVLRDVTAGNLSVSQSNNQVFSPSSSNGSCETINSSFVCAPNSVAMGNVIDPTGYGSFSATSRHGISTGNLAVGNVSFTSYAGGIGTGDIGTALAPAASVYLNTNTTGTGGSVTAGAIEAGSTSIYSDASISVGTLLAPAAINAANPGGSSVYLYTSNGAITTGAVDASSIQMNAYGVGTIATGRLNGSAAVTFPGSVNLNADVSVTTGAIDADSLSIGGHCCTSYPAISTGAIGGALAGNSMTMSGSTISIGGAVTLDAAGNSNLDVVATGNLTIAGNVATGLGGSLSVPMRLDASGLLSINGGNGVITAADGSYLSLRAGNTNVATPFQFARISAGPAGGVTVNAPAGIRQTLASASGGGITAATVTLNADSGGSAIEGPTAGVDALTLRGTSSVTVTTGGAVRIDRTDGVNPIPLLTNVDISQGDATQPFSLTGYSGGQAVTLAYDGVSGAQVTATTSGGAPMSFRYQNSGGANPDITGLGIATKGGQVILDSTNGAVVAGNVDTTDAGGGSQVSISAAQALTVNGTVDAGAGQVILAGRSIGGSGSVASTYGGSLSSPAVRAEASAGDIGSSGTHLSISADSVDLSARRSGTGGDVNASLAGSSAVKVFADNGFTIASDTALTRLAITTRGDGVGAVTLVAPGQGYGFVRNGTAVDITTVSSPTPLTSLGVSVTNGDLRLVGTGANAFAADTLTLFTSGNLSLDGTGAPVMVSSATYQEFVATGNLSLTGTGTFTSGGGQQFRSNGDTVFQAQAGTLTASGVDQVFLGRDIRLLGGASSGDAITLSATGSQSFNATRNIDFLGGSGNNAAVSVSLTGNGGQTLNTSGGGNITLGAGAGNGASVTLAASGSGSQTLYADGNLVMTGGGTIGVNADASVSVTKSGGNTQRLDAGGSISLTGGAGDRGAVTVANSGPGNQEFGDDFCCSNPTDSLTVQGGAGVDSFALVNAAGRQFIKPTAALNVLGGAGDGAYARINTDLTTSSGTSISSGPQIIGYSFAFDCCSGNQIQTIALTAGAGSGAYAEISSSGSQRVAASTSMVLTGTAASGAFARLKALSQDVRTGATTLAAGTGNGANASIEAVGAESNRASGSSFLQLVDPSSLTLTAGGTSGANTALARIVSGGSQSVASSPTVLTGGAGPGANAEIIAVNQQTLSLGNLTMLAGAGDGASARIRTSALTGSQSVSASTTSLTGGSGQNAKAYIESGASQSLSFGTLTATGGVNQGADAYLKADNGQNINAGTTTLTGGTGTAARDASANIFNDHGSQTLSVGNLTVRSGADYGAAFIRTLGSGQTIGAGAITIGTSAGANNGGTTFASIEHQGSGTQTITSSSITVSNQHAPGRVGIYAPGDQVIGSSGVVTVQVAGGAGAAEIVSAAGTQTVRGNSASTADAGQVASGGSANGGVRVQVSGGSGGTARIASLAGPQNIIGAFVDISTSASGSAAISATGNQWIRTTNGAASGVGSLQVAALGGGNASLTSGAYQLLQIDYPELMQAGRDGRITVGGAGATGSSRIQAVNQDVFARSIAVLGGSVAGANAKIDVSGIQNVSLVSSGATPGAGATVTGGAGGTALIDPVTQTILSNGAISVTGGGGPGTVAGIVGGGDQTVLVTSGGAGSISVAGGAGSNAFGQIITGGNVQRIGTSGGFTLSGGSGSNADAIIGANGGTAETFLACGSGFTCNAGTAPFTAIPSVTNPFVNGTTDVGVYYSPISVPLTQIIAATGGAPAGESGAQALPFDPTALTLRIPNLDLNPEDEEREFLRGRRLPVCR